MGIRMPVCRCFVFLFLLGLIVIGVNISFLYMDSPQQGCTCNCATIEYDFPQRHVDILSTEKSYSLPSKPPPFKPPIKQQNNNNLPVDLLVLGVNYRQMDFRKLHTPELIKDAEGDVIDDSHQLAVVVPFRNRFEEMIEFVPYIHKFLDRQQVRHQIWVINQVDNHRFNRASLLNIGFLLSRNECDYLVMHDIDLLPVNDNLKYSYPSKGPLHISSPELHPQYHYQTFVGGVLALTREQFEEANGLSNLYWGWGKEDDEFFIRMKEAGMRVHYPQGITTGYKTFKHIHDKVKRPRDQKTYKNQKEISRKRDRVTGLHSVRYKLVSNIEMTIDGAPLHFVSVTLECDYDVTPFCDDMR